MPIFYRRGRPSIPPRRNRPPEEGDDPGARQGNGTHEEVGPEGAHASRIFFGGRRRRAPGFLRRLVVEARRPVKGRLLDGSGLRARGERERDDGQCDRDHEPARECVGAQLDEIRHHRLAFHHLRFPVHRLDPFPLVFKGTRPFGAGAGQAVRRDTGKAAKKCGEKIA